MKAAQPCVLSASLTSGDMKSNHLQVCSGLNLVSLSLNLLLVCFQVAVQLEASPDFLTAPMEKELKSHCVCLNERHTVSWVITPKSLGEPRSPRGTGVTAEALCLFPDKDPQAEGLIFFDLHSRMPNTARLLVHTFRPALKKAETGSTVSSGQPGSIRSLKTVKVIHDFKASQGQSGVQGQSCPHHK